MTEPIYRYFETVPYITVRCSVIFCECPPPELYAAHLEHLLEHGVPAQLAAQGQGGQLPVVPEHGGRLHGHVPLLPHKVVGLLDGVLDGVAEHAELLLDDDHVEDGVAVGVLGVGVGSLLDQEVVDSLVTEAGCPGQGVFSQVGQALQGGQDITGAS